MKSRKLSESKEKRMEIIEIEELARKFLPALNEMCSVVSKYEKFPECLCLVLAVNKKEKTIKAGMIDSIDGISDKAEIKMLNVKEEFLHL